MSTAFLPTTLTRRLSESFCVFLDKKSSFRFLEPLCRISNYLHPNISLDVILQARKTMFLTTFPNTENRVESKKNLENINVESGLTSRFLGMWLNTVLSV